MTTSEPTPIAVAVVQYGNDVLIGLRPPKAPLGDLWEFPGGKILPPESPDQAALRECREETGLDVRILQPLAIVEHSYESGRVRLHFLLAEPLDPNVPPTEPFRWVARADLGQYRFPSANVAVIEWLVGS